MQYTVAAPRRDGPHSARGWLLDIGELLLVLGARRTPHEIQLGVAANSREPPQPHVTTRAKTAPIAPPPVIVAIIVKRGDAAPRSSVARLTRARGLDARVSHTRGRRARTQHDRSGAVRGHGRRTRLLLAAAAGRSSTPPRARLGSEAERALLERRERRYDAAREDVVPRAIAPVERAHPVVAWRARLRARLELDDRAQLVELRPGRRRGAGAATRGGARGRWRSDDEHERDGATPRAAAGGDQMTNTKPMIPHRARRRVAIQ